MFSPRSPHSFVTFVENVIGMFDSCVCADLGIERILKSPTLLRVDAWKGCSQCGPSWQGRAASYSDLRVWQGGCLITAMRLWQVVSRRASLERRKCCHGVPNSPDFVVLTRMEISVATPPLAGVAPCVLSVIGYPGESKGKNRQK